MIGMNGHALSWLFKISSRPGRKSRSVLPTPEEIQDKLKELALDFAKTLEKMEDLEDDDEEDQMEEVQKEVLQEKRREEISGLKKDSNNVLMQLLRTGSNMTNSNIAIHCTIGL